jgi:hypothetical protein
MKVLFILFFISLFFIAFLIGRKLFILRKNKAQADESELEIEYSEFLIEIPNIEVLKNTIVVNFKKVLYALTVLAIKYYIKSSNYLKKQTVLAYKKIKEKISKKSDTPLPTEKPASNFLKTVKEYKKKIDRIKHKIKKEESLK